MKLILASASKGRKHLLDLLKIPYEVMPTDIDEEKIIGKTPLETIQLRAEKKAEEASRQIDKILQLQSFVNGCLILAADTEVVIDKQLIGKPKDYEDGIRILKLLSGKTHEVITAVYTITGNTRRQDYDISRVTFKKLTTEEIKRYLKLTDYTRYTGGYALLASPQDFVVNTSGSLSNIIGLPLEKVIPILRENKFPV